MKSHPWLPANILCESPCHCKDTTLGSFLSTAELCGLSVSLCSAIAILISNGQNTSEWLSLCLRLKLYLVLKCKGRKKWEKGHQNCLQRFLPEKRLLRKKMNLSKRLIWPRTSEGCRRGGLHEACSKQWAQMSNKESISLLLLEDPRAHCSEANLEDLVTYSTRAVDLTRLWLKMTGSAWNYRNQCSCSVTPLRHYFPDICCTCLLHFLSFQAAEIRRQPGSACDAS